MIRNLSVFFVLFLFSINAVAQYIDEYPVNSSNGTKMMVLKNYQVAVKIYSELLKEKPDDIDFRFQLGSALTYSTINQSRGLELLKQVDESANKPKGLKKVLATAYFMNYEFKTAISTFEKAKSESSDPDEIKEIETWILQCKTSMHLQSQPIPITFENLGKYVNSDSPDYLPLVAPDESVLIFSTRRNGVVGNLFDYGGYKTADIYTSKHKRNKYSRARSIGSPNTYGNEETAGTSENGNFMIYNVDSDEHYSDLFVSKKGRRSYMPAGEFNSDLVNLKSKEPGASLTNNGDRLYFCSDREGGFGGFDIYWTQRLPNGDWGEPVNLGKDINTSKDELYPNIRNNETEIYFSSNGYPSMGGLDLFKSVKVDNKWSQPVNLGYPLNTVNDDKNISFAKNPRYAYIGAKRDDSFGDLDIYRIVFEDKKEELCLITGALMREDSSAILEEVIIEIINNETGELFGSYLSNPKTGKYIAILPPGNYLLEIIDANNYENAESKIIIKDKNDFMPMKKLDLFLKVKTKAIIPATPASDSLNKDSQIEKK